MAPLVEAGEIRQMSMLMMSAVVNGPPTRSPGAGSPDT
jgi:hypothetical protein